MCSTYGVGERAKRCPIAEGLIGPGFGDTTNGQGRMPSCLGHGLLMNKGSTALKMIASSALFLSFYFLQKRYSVDREPPVHPCVKDGKCMKGKGKCVVSVCVMNKDRQMYDETVATGLGLGLVVKVRGYG